MMAAFSDETVMRYVDGELDDETSAQVEAALANDPELSRRIELFAETRLAAQEAMRRMLDEPVPDALKGAVEAMVAKAKAAPDPTLATWRVGSGRPHIVSPANDWMRLAAAACIAGVLGVGAGMLVGGETEPGGLRIANVDADAVATGLRSIPTGSETTLAGAATRFKAIATFRDSRQALCREFELDLADRSTVTSVACSVDGNWVVRFAVNAPAGDDGYAPASSSEALEAYLAAINAGAPLSETEEKQALDQLP